MPVDFGDAFDLGDTVINNRTDEGRSYRGIGIAVIVGLMEHLANQNDQIIELLTAIKDKP